jgi:hypothetical protein
MFNLTGVPKVLGVVFRRGGIIAKHYRPEIFTGVGIIGVGVCVVTACVATLKIEAVLDESRAKVAEIKGGQEEHPDKYSADDAKKDLMVVQGRTALAIVKLYAIPASVGVASIALILGGHHILRKEHAAISAAYMGLTEAFKKYRERVIADQGKDKDREYRFGTVKEQILVENENGQTETRIVEHCELGQPSLYARCFDASNINFCREPENNLRFLRLQERVANQRLHAQGHLFLNDIYEALGFEKTEGGQLVGWVDGYGDGYVDFHLYDIESQQARDFINGYTNNVLLDFNVDGEVYQIFSKKEYARKLADPTE